jgi:hypothetical protein
MPEEMLGQELITEDELIKKINKEIKVDNRPPLTKKMLAYLRDVVGLIPKAIHMRFSKRGGPRAYYTKEACEAAFFVLTENWKKDKTLKEIKNQNGDFFEAAHQASDLFRQKVDVYKKVKVGEYVNLQIVPAGAPSQVVSIGEVNKKLESDLEKALDALRAKHPDEKILDGLLDQVYLQYQERLKCRMVGDTGKKERK